MNGQRLVGIDVGGTKVAGLATAGGEIVAEDRRPLDGADVAGQVVAVARELAARLGGTPDAIGIAAPGQVDAARGVVELAVNLGVRDLPLGTLVGDALEAPTAVEHDARAVASWLAEDGHGTIPANLAYLSVGTGISAGVVLDGRLLRGAAGLAGEVGHLVANGGEERCACGLLGCLETVASGPAVARAAARMGGNGRTTADVYRAAGEGDVTATGIVEAAAAHLAAALRGLALAYGVERIVVGGGVAQAGTPFAAPLRDALDRERARSPLVARALRDVTLEIVSDDRPLGAQAALALARRTADGRARARGEVGTR